MTPVKLWTLALMLVAVIGFGQGVRVALGMVALAPVSFDRTGRPLDAETFRTASARGVGSLVPTTPRNDVALESAP